MKRASRPKAGLQRHLRPPTESLVLQDSPKSQVTLPESLAVLLQRPLTTPLSAWTPIDGSRRATFEGNTFELVSFASHTTDGRVIVADAGNGPVSSLDWCKCCGSFLATSAYPNSDFKDLLTISQPIPSRIIIWKLDPKEPSLTLHLVLEHSYGAVRSLSWFPTKAKGAILAASFADMKTRIFAVPLGEKGPSRASLSNLPMHIFDNCCSFSWGLNSSQILTGSFDGLVSMWDLSATRPNRIFARKACDRPIFCMSQCPQRPWLIAVGGYDQGVVLLDLTSPSDLEKIYNSLSTHQLSTILF